MNHFLVHGKDDTVGVMTVDIKAGENLSGWNMDQECPVSIKTNSDIPLGHKIALADIKQGVPVLKYDHPIGNATQDITAGDHVHTHNLKSTRW
jgi:(2R)-sulfolactate sulfo-lyase subunit alpha